MEFLVLFPQANAVLKRQNKFSMSNSYIEEYVMIHKPIAQALEFLQQDRNILFGYLLPTLATVRNQFRVLQNNANFKILSSELTKLMEDSLVKIFELYFNLSPEVDLGIKASALCPAVKMNYLKALRPTITKSKQKNIYLRVKNRIESEIRTAGSEQILPEPEIEYFDFDCSSKYFILI